MQMLDPVIAMCQLQSQIRNRKSASKGHAVEVPFKKHKRSSSFSSTSIPGHPNPLNSGSCKEVILLLALSLCLVLINLYCFYIVGNAFFILFLEKSLSLYLVSSSCLLSRWMMICSSF